jgi:hypothetical protein
MAVHFLVDIDRSIPALRTRATTLSGRARNVTNQFSLAWFVLCNRSPAFAAALTS